MKKTKKILLFLTGFVASFGLLFASACSFGGENDLEKAYNTYVEYAREQGEEPLVYEDWIKEWVYGAQGDKGEQGVGVESSYWTADGELVLVLTNGKELNVGKIAPPAHEHTYGEWEDIISTCTSRWQTRICSVCGDSQNRSIAPVGHDYKQGVCTVCGGQVSDEYKSTYGYDYFSSLENGEKLQAFYERIETAVQDFHTDEYAPVQEDVFAVVNYQTLGLTLDEAVAVWKTFKDDNPLFYWFDNKTQIAENGLKLFAIDEYADGAIRMETTQNIYDKIEEYKDVVKGETSEYMIALAYHDAIISAIDYAYSGNGMPSNVHWAHSIVGVLENRGGVCEAYARTYQLLLNASDVENVFVTGMGNSEKHGWNMVKLDDGNWYHVDLTWDDTPRFEWGISYQYFCVSDLENVHWVDDNSKPSAHTFSYEHTANTPQNTGVNFLYELPKASQTEFNHNGVLKVRNKFTVGEDTYAVAGYNTVQFLSSECEGALVIPERVEYADRTYTVISVGAEKPTSINGYPWKEEETVLFGGGTSVLYATSVYLPKTVRFIWDYAIGGSFLQTITVDAANEYFTAQDNVLFTKSLYTLIQYPDQDPRTEYVIPDETRIVAKGAITNGLPIALEKLTIGKNVKTMNRVNWGMGYIDSDAEDLGGATVAGQLSTIVECMQGKAEIIVSPENQYYTADDSAIYNKRMTTVLAIFKHTKVFEIPATVNYLELSYGLMRAADSLEKFTLAQGNQAFSVQDGVVYNANKTQLLAVPPCVTGEIVIPNGVTEIPDNAFNDRVNVTKVILPDSVTVIGTSAFSKCYAMREINLPNALIAIGTGAFWNCTALESIFIPKGVKEMGFQVFTHCQNLKIYCEAEEQPQTWDENWLGNLPKETPVWNATRL